MGLSAGPQQALGAVFYSRVVAGFRGAAAGPARTVVQVQELMVE
jgi:hypothetical protein|uniref:Uncharacterized protein n=1 Tax=Ralstonia pickettii (strain 12D) TaxID=428406 RepID=C6BF64_RALP1